MIKKKPSRMAVVGSELMKLNFGGAAKALTAPRGEYLNTSNYRASQLWQFLPGGNDVHFSWNGSGSAVQAYQECSPLTAIINKKAQAYSGGKVYVLDQDGKEPKTGPALKLRRLMARPNPLQTWKQLDAMVYLFKQLFGYCVVLKIKPVGFSGDLDTTRIWVLPPHLTTIQEKVSVNIMAAQGWADFIERIDFTWGGYSTTLPIDSIFLFRDITPSLSTPSLPESRVRANEQIISNIIGAYESRGVLIDKRGPTYVISSGNKDADGTAPMSPIEKDAVEKDFTRYGLTRGQVNAIISTAALQVATVGFDVKQLGLFEEIEDDIMRLCDSWGYPYALMASNRTNQLGGNNIGESNKKLYQDAIMPEAEDQCAEWDQFFGLAALGLRFDRDYTHVAALQEDRVQQATARKMLNESLEIEWRNGLLTLNQWLEKLGEDPLPQGGDIRITDIKNTNVPLAVTLGVGGTESLIAMLTAQGLSAAGRRAAIRIVFGIADADALAMVPDTPPPANPQNPNNPV
jgi:hypothetical protein